MGNKNSATSLGSTLLQTAFIVLKLCHVIDWSWWWVLSPLWITTSIAIIALIGLGIYRWRKSANIKKRIIAFVEERIKEKISDK